MASARHHLRQDLHGSPQSGVATFSQAPADRHRVYPSQGFTSRVYPFGDSRRSLPPSTRVCPLVEDSRDSWDSHKLATFKQETTGRVTSFPKGSAPAITSRRSGFQQQPHDLCSNMLQFFELSSLASSSYKGTIWYTQVLFKKFALLGPWDQNGGISGPWVRC